MEGPSEITARRGARPFIDFDGGGGGRGGGERDDMSERIAAETTGTAAAYVGNWLAGIAAR